MLAIILLLLIIVLFFLTFRRKEFFADDNFTINDFKFIFISLEHDLIKRKEFLNNCQLVNLNPFRFKAINGKLLNNQQKKDLVYQNYLTNQFLSTKTPGQIGCGISHLKVLENNINSNKHLIIFEDDAIINIHFIKKLSVFLTYIPKDWEMFYLYINDFYLNDTQQKNGRRQRIKITEHIYKPIGPYGLICYGINKNNISKILNLIKPLDQYPIDKKLSFLINQKKIKAYCPPTNIVKHPNIYYSNTFQKLMNRKEISPSV